VSVHRRLAFGVLKTSQSEAFMSKLAAKFLGVVILSAAVSSAVTPALALGGCGPNFHRNWAGQCVWGGQNQAWCLRHTGHPAVRAPNGEMICYR
jgi:hypothetical protein